MYVCVQDHTGHDLLIILFASDAPHSSSSLLSLLAAMMPCVQAKYKGEEESIVVGLEGSQQDREAH